MLNTLELMDLRQFLFCFCIYVCGVVKRALEITLQYTCLCFVRYPVPEDDVRFVSLPVKVFLLYTLRDRAQRPKAEQ